MFRDNELTCWTSRGQECGVCEEGCAGVDGEEDGR